PMGGRCCSSRNWLFGPVLALALPALASPSHAATETHKDTTHKVVQPARDTRDVHHSVNHVVRVSHVGHASVHSAVAHGYGGRARVRVVGISCVPYARSATGITVAGNAWQWWDHAAGTYERGSVPEPG